MGRRASRLRSATARDREISWVISRFGPAGTRHADMAASSSGAAPPPPAICLATMLDVSRLSSLVRMRGAWYGELSAACLARQNATALTARSA